VIIKRNQALTKSFCQFDIEALLDEFVTTTIKKKEYNRIINLFNLVLPPNILLTIWLIIAKKCKGLLDSNTSQLTPSAKKNTQEEEKTYKSSIMRSLLVTKEEIVNRNVKLKNNNIFEILLKNLENLSGLDNELYD
jgi:hypothetical protein